MELEIFKVGKHTSSNGLTKDYTLDDLNSIILNHTEPTPIVVGHPKNNSPAFGWIKNLFLKGESLFAEASDLVPEFLDLVKQKMYKNRSVSLSQLEDGTLALNHVGFLGGAMPAVKGLEELNLNADEDAQIIHEFALSVELDDTKETVSPLPRGTEGGSETQKEKEKEKTFSLEQFNSLKSDVAKIVEFIESYPVQNVQIPQSDLQAKIDELNLKIDLAYFQKNIVDKLQLDNLTPAIKNKIIAILNYFQTLDFAQDQQSKIVSDFQELADLIQPFQTEEILKKVVKVSPFSRGTEGGSGGSEFDLMNVDKESMQLFNEATQLSEEESISFNEALNILINKNSEV
ncbi:MAG: hypothetical protein KKF62_01945 [Bacteroidetes bacterium]|nr:hypothetical protein [Bacteroidota bacterium]MBU1115326.1 hypothetical protein [Bacteroidota bacterium]MBU1799685.1 hypothetical protein [Bacteroidota bacterium]